MSLGNYFSVPLCYDQGNETVRETIVTVKSQIIRDSTVWDFKMWPLAVLTGDRIDGFFLMGKCMIVMPGRKKVAVKRGDLIHREVDVKRGSSVFVKRVGKTEVPERKTFRAKEKIYNKINHIWRRFCNLTLP